MPVRYDTSVNHQHQMACNVTLVYIVFQYIMLPARHFARFILLCGRATSISQEPFEDL